MKLKRKVVMLPINEKAENCILKIKGNLFYHRGYYTQRYLDSIGYLSNHLYIISDDEIKDEDFVYHSLNKNIIKITKDDLQNKDIRKYGYRKVIATTNNLLNLPLIRESFINKFILEYNKGNIIEEVLVEYNEFTPSNSINLNDGYTKTLAIDSDNCITIFRIKDSFTLEEHKLDMQYYMEYCIANGYITPEDWLNKYKQY